MYSKKYILIWIGFFLLSKSLYSTTYLVTNINDSGPGSLRQAILDSNSSSGLDNINFMIPGSGPFIISPKSLLPNITNPVIIDGYTQPGSQIASQNDKTYIPAIIQIIVDGSLVEPGNGFVISSPSGSTIKGLQIQGFKAVPPFFGNQGSGILLLSSNNTIIGNFLGPVVNIDGVPGKPNELAGLTIGFGTINNIIGTSSIADRNIISGNLLGLLLGGIENIIKGNIFGLNETGTAALPNLFNGMSIAGEAKNNIIGGLKSGEANIFSGNLEYGIGVENVLVVGPAQDNLIIGNIIGPDITGNNFIPNKLGGIGFRNFSQAQNNTIKCNLIAGNNNTGIYIGSTCNKNSILSNSIYINGSQGILLAFGGNDMLAAPILTSGVTSGDTLVITGKLQNQTLPPFKTFPDTKYRIEFFINDTDALEGKTFIGTTETTTDNNGDTIFIAKLQSTAPRQKFVTATATALSGTNAGDTSQFSDPLTLLEGSKESFISIKVNKKYCSNNNLSC